MGIRDLELPEAAGLLISDVSQMSSTRELLTSFAFRPFQLEETPQKSGW